MLRMLAESPELFLRDIDPGRGAAILSPMSEDSYRDSTFLDNRSVRAGERDIVVPVDALIAILADSDTPAPPIRYIFHIGHCGSTLIARLLGELDQFLSLREPPVLMGLSRSYRVLGSPEFGLDRERWQALFELAVILLSRTWHPEQRALVKTTSHAGNLIPQLMTRTGDERALFLYLDLETYLATMLRSHTRQENRLYARDFRVREFAGLATAQSADFDDYSDAQIAALTWLLHMREFALALDQTEIRERSVALTFDEYLASPQQQLGRICEFLGTRVSTERLATLLTGPAATTHAKQPDARFDASERARQLDVGRSKSAAEIETGRLWAAEVCGNEPAFAGLRGWLD